MDGADDDRQGVRHRDPGLTAYELTADDVLVTCPSCQGCARVVVTSRTDEWLASWPRRLVCPHCSLVQERPPRSGSAWGGATDPYFGAPLWLQSPCCGGRVLWAYNERHLSVLRAHVAAKLRERPPSDLGPTSMLERLPSWITSAQHREEVVRTIDRLQRRVPPRTRTGT